MTEGRGEVLRVKFGGKSAFWVLRVGFESGVLC